MTTFFVVVLLLVLLEVGVALGWASDSRDGRDTWPFAARTRHDGE